MRSRALSPPQLLVIVMVTLAPSAAWSAGSVTVNGCSLHCDPPPMEIEGRLLLPLSFVEMGLGVTARQDETGLWELVYFGTRLYLRRNTAAYLLNDQPGRAHAKTVEFEDELYIPLGMLAMAFGWDIQTLTTTEEKSIEIGTGGAEVRAIRSGPRPEAFRLVLDLDRPAPFAYRQSAGILRVTVPCGPPRPSILRPSRSLSFDHPLVASVQQVPSEGATDVLVELTAEAETEVFNLADPPRIVVDIWPSEEAVTAPGPLVRGPWQRRNFGTARGAAQVNVLVVDAGSAEVDLRPALAGESLRARERVSAMCRREGAIAGINGGYFAGTGEPLGLLMIDGEFITAPPRARTALIIHTDGSVSVERVGLYARATLPGVGAYAISAVNEGHREGDQLVLYTRRHARELGGNLSTTRVALDRGGAIVGMLSRTNDPLKIPEGGSALSGKGAFVQRLARLKSGTRVVIELGTSPALADVAHILGAGPRLLRNGDVDITAGAERFRPDVAHGAAPRSAVGLAADGKLILATVDGRGVNGSTGMTLYELARTMQHLGARDAVNLDGGGSSTLVIAGRVVNGPSDGHSRRVSNALLVFAKPETLGLALP